MFCVFVGLRVMDVMLVVFSASGYWKSCINLMVSYSLVRLFTDGWHD